MTANDTPSPSLKSTTLWTRCPWSARLSSEEQPLIVGELTAGSPQEERGADSKRVLMSTEIQKPALQWQVAKQTLTGEPADPSESKPESQDLFLRAEIMTKLLNAALMILSV